MRDRDRWCVAFRRSDKDSIQWAAEAWTPAEAVPHAARGGLNAIANLIRFAEPWRSMREHRSLVCSL